MNNIYITILAMVISLSCQSKVKVDLNTVSQFDIKRYMGLWYEIARYENRFEKGMTNPTAKYSFMANGMVLVENIADLNGVRKTSIGKAKVDKSGQAGSLKVAFFLNFYAPYKILMLDPQYNYALVASSNKYLWILARTPKLDNQTLQKILTEATKRGFDVTKLIYTQERM